MKRVEKVRGLGRKEGTEPMRGVWWAIRERELKAKRALDWEVIQIKRDRRWKKEGIRGEETV